MTGPAFSPVLLYSGSGWMPLLLTAAAVAGVLYLCYRLSRFLTKSAGRSSGSGNIRILERAAFGPDKGLAIVKVCGSCYLIGFSSNRIEILKELDPAELRPPARMPQNFLDLLESALGGRRGRTENGQKRGKGGF